MGLIVLHSGHHSKLFKALMGTPCSLSWRDDDFERIWVIDPSHPIAQGLDKYFELEKEEMYGEPFSIPEPDKLIFAGWYEGGELFRSGCTYKRGNGNIFYFQPGHETNPTFHNPNIQKVITNAVYWAKPVIRQEILCPQVERIVKK
jgi:trehalose utilization protein